MGDLLLPARFLGHGWAISTLLFAEEEEGGMLGAVRLQFLAVNEWLRADGSAQNQETTFLSGLRSFGFDCSRWELINWDETVQHHAGQCIL